MSCKDCKSNLYPYDPSMPMYNRFKHKHERSECSICPSFKPEPLPDLNVIPGIGYMTLDGWVQDTEVDMLTELEKLRLRQDILNNKLNNNLKNKDNVTSKRKSYKYE